MERRVVLASVIAHAMTHGMEVAFAALLLRIGAEFGVGLAALGVVANLGTITFGATAIPAGYLSDRYGERAVITFAMVGGAALCALVAASPNLPFLAVALALLGAAIGLYHPPGTAMVATLSVRRGRALARHGVAGNVGLGVAPALATVVAIAVDWRAAYLVLGALALFAALAVWRLTPGRDEAEAERRRLRAREQADPRRRAGSTPPRERHWLMPSLLLVYFAAVGQGFVYRGAITFLPAHLEEHLGLSLFGWDAEAMAGAMTTIVLLIGVAGQLAGGRLIDRMLTERAAIPFTVLLVPALLLMAPASGWLLVLASVGFVIGNWGQQPIFNSLMADYAPGGAVGRAFGFQFFMAFGIGSVAGSAAGVVAERAGTGAAFVMLSAAALAMLIALLVVLVGSERRRAEHAALDAVERAAG
jgi:predicted MFS family arabinose efflux permease